MKRNFFSLLCLLLVTVSVTVEGASRKRSKKSEVTTPSVVKSSAYTKLFSGKKCKTVKGLVTLHMVDDEKVYIEFPLNLVGRDMLLGSTVSEISNNEHAVLGYKSKYPIHVTFEKAPKHMNLCMVNSLYTTSEDELKGAVAKSTIGSIFKTFKIEAYNADSTAVVFDATPLFVSHIEDIDPFDPNSRFGSKPFSRTVSFQKDRSHLSDVKSFSDNFAVYSYLTYNSNVMYRNGNMMSKVETNAPVTALVNRSFLLLPEEPMRPRLADPRMNIFPMGKGNFSVNNNRGTLPDYYARRWDLEPKDLEAWKAGELVEPVKPIVFYVDEHIPAEWRAPIKEAVEQWNEAFEKIGFKYAVRAKDYPKNDPEFDPDNLKYSCIRYQPISIKNAMGPSWIDPRSGEIINASVMVYHDVLKLLHNWLYVQTAQANPRVRSGVIPQDIMDDAMRYVLAHEVGHCLSLMHNMSSSAAVPTDSLRSATFTQKYGTTYSIMDYARFNYVAQPGDMEKGVKLTPPRLGVYDFFSIKWLYQPLPEAKTFRDELPILNKWISEKSDDPIYRYGKQQIYGIVDPSSQSEDLGDDLVKSSEYGVQNLKYIMANLNDWLTDDEDLSLREELYGAILQQYFQYIYHVYNVKGGVYLNERYQGDKRPSYAFVEGEYQRRAQKFLCEQLSDLDWMEPQELLTEMPLLGNKSIKMQRLILSLIMADRGILTKINVDEKDAYSIEENQTMAMNEVFKSTKRGVTLSKREMSNQIDYVNYLLLLSGMQKPASKGGSPMGIADEAVPFISNSLHTADQNVMADEFVASPKFDEITPEQVSGFGFFKGVSESMSPQHHIYYGKIMEIRDLLNRRKNSGSSQTRNHYQILLHTINGVLQ